MFLLDLAVLLKSFNHFLQFNSLLISCAGKKQKNYDILTQKKQINIPSLKSPLLIYTGKPAKRFLKVLSGIGELKLFVDIHTNQSLVSAEFFVRYRTWAQTIKTKAY